MSSSHHNDEEPYKPSGLDGGRFCEWCGGMKRGRGRGYCPDRQCKENHKQGLVGYASKRAKAEGICYRCGNDTNGLPHGFCENCLRLREYTAREMISGHNKRKRASNNQSEQFIGGARLPSNMAHEDKIDVLQKRVAIGKRAAKKLRKLLSNPIGYCPVCNFKLRGNGNGYCIKCKGKSATSKAAQFSCEVCGKRKENPEASFCEECRQAHEITKGLEYHDEVEGIEL